MTGKFTEKDPERCAHYARFFKDLTLAEASLIFWTLFTIVLILMCIASLQHHKSNVLTERNKSLPKHITSSPEHKLKVRRIRLHYLSVASLCFILGITAAIFECFALFNIQFCDGEDLMQIYWGFWSVLQVGSNIAILGVMVQFWIVLGDIETPSWAVALGTPVLVFAAIGFGVRHCFKETCGSFILRRDAALEDEEMGRGRELSSEGERGERQREREMERDDREGPRDESEREKYVADRSLSNAPTMVPTATQNSRNSSVSFEDPESDPPSIENVSVGRHSTFWQRDLRNMLNEVVSTHPLPARAH